MNDSSSPALGEARKLFEAGRMTEAGQLLGRALEEHPDDTAILNFQAYLLYKQGHLGEASEVYHRLTEHEPDTSGHWANLGLIYFKTRQFDRAQESFERVLSLVPDEPRALRNLGFCYERRGNLVKALESFARSGDDAQAERVRALMAARGEEKKTTPPLRTAPVPAGCSGEPEAVDMYDWIASLAVPSGEGAAEPEMRSVGREHLVVQVAEKRYINPSYLSAHRGVVLFAPPFRDAQKAVKRFGGSGAALVRVEGSGDVCLSGRGRSLHFCSLHESEIIVNAAALALCSPDLEVTYAFDFVERGVFLAATLSGSGQFVLALRGDPLVLPISEDLPAFVRPGAAAAWTADVYSEAEQVADLRRIGGRRSGTRLRFEGAGYLLLHGGSGRP